MLFILFTWGATKFSLRFFILIVFFNELTPLFQLRMVFYGLKLLDIFIELLLVDCFGHF